MRAGYKSPFWVKVLLSALFLPFVGLYPISQGYGFSYFQLIISPDFSSFKSLHYTVIYKLDPGYSYKRGTGFMNKRFGLAHF